MCSAEFVLQQPGHRPAIYRGMDGGDMETRIWGIDKAQEERRGKENTRSFTPRASLWPAEDGEGGRGTSAVGNDVYLRPADDSCTHSVKQLSVYWTALPVQLLCLLSCERRQDVWGPNVIMSCAARALIRPRNDPSVSCSDEEVFVLLSLFTSCPHRRVMLCRLASSACDQHVTVFFFFFYRISDQFYNLAYVQRAVWRRLTALESAAHLTVLIFTVTSQNVFVFDYVFITTWYQNRIESENSGGSWHVIIVV